MKFIFITGGGRCGTTLVRSLLDGNSHYGTLPVEMTRFLETFLEDFGYGVHLPTGVTVDEMFATRLISHLLDDPVADTSERRSRLNTAFQALIQQSGGDAISLPQFFETACDAFFDGQSDTVVVDVQSPRIAGYLEQFDGAKIIHMIRHPMHQYNSNFRFRHADATTSGGEYPGRWNMTMAHDDIRTAFTEAVRFNNHPQVRVTLMENMQSATEQEIAQILDFIGVPTEPINGKISKLGASSDAGSTYGEASQVIRQDGDVSCLTDNDRYWLSRVPGADTFYDMPPAPAAKNTFWPFLKRQWGYSGKDRTPARSPVRLFKGAILAVSYYLQDLHHKFYLPQPGDGKTQ